MASDNETFAPLGSGYILSFTQSGFFTRIESICLACQLQIWLLTVLILYAVNVASNRI